MNPFPILEAIAPAIGARLAERLWFTLPPTPRFEPVEPTAVATDICLSVAGATVHGRTWGAAGHPIALLMHGWGGTKEQLAGFVDPLIEAGFEVVAFDAPSHGASDPGRFGRRQTTFVEFIDAMAAFAAELGPIDIVIAHSGGAMAAAGALDQGQVSAEQLVFIAPFAYVGPFTHSFAQQAGFGERIRRRLVSRIEKRVGSPIGDWEIAAMAPRLQHLPLLLLHDEGDNATPAASSREIAEAWAGAELKITSGLGHNRVLADTDVIETVVRFAASRAGATA